MQEVRGHKTAGPCEGSGRAGEIRALLREAAAHSTCRAIRLGVVIETKESGYLLGWNGPPGHAGAHDECLLGGRITPDSIRRCPSVHAEVRAICRAAERGIPIKGATLYLSQWFCCAPCAVAMIEAGISRLVLTEDICYEKDDCYNFRLAEDLLDKSGVTVLINPALKPASRPA